MGLVEFHGNLLEQDKSAVSSTTWFSTAIRLGCKKVTASPLHPNTAIFHLIWFIPSSIIFRLIYESKHSTCRHYPESHNLKYTWSHKILLIVTYII